MRALLDWFKHEYMAWVDNLPCAACAHSDTVAHGDAEPTPDELRDGASRVELFLCPLCSSVSRFPRYNNPARLMQTRRGRCGEWANLFTLFSITMGFETRYVMDYTDHVWCEFWSDDWNRWVHVDPSEGGGSLDQPLMYEVGWKKQLTYVFAIGEHQVIDVFRRYTRNVDAVLGRRKLARETQIEIWTREITYSLRQTISPALAVSLQARDAQEYLELMNPQSRALGESEKLGRQSGNLEWRLARGETDVAGSSNPATIAPTVNESQKILSMSSTAAFQFLGSATTIPSTSPPSTQVIQLTPARTDQVGAVWAKIPASAVTKASSNTQGQLIIDFTFRAGNPNEEGADGLALVFQSAGPRALGNGGSGMGYAGIPHSVAIEFDMYASRDSCNDPDGNHVSIQTCGSQPNSAHHRHSRGCSSRVPSLAEGKLLAVRVVWNLAENNLDVFMNDDVSGGQVFELVVRGNVELANVLKGGGTSDWFVGFTAATGGLSQVHQLISFNMYLTE
ncbi:hypothetical protein BDR26DRAFT_855751 [Obelidium mucronatum]|nr:hypothetical protein BDR26DRAFT_855751 [Obelidium mucronatum]